MSNIVKGFVSIFLSIFLFLSTYWYDIDKKLFKINKDIEYTKLNLLEFQKIKWNNYIFINWILQDRSIIKYIELKDIDNIKRLYKKYVLKDIFNLSNDLEEKILILSNKYDISPLDVFLYNINTKKDFDIWIAKEDLLFIANSNIKLKKDLLEYILISIKDTKDNLDINKLRVLEKKYSFIKEKKNIKEYFISNFNLDIFFIRYFNNILDLKVNDNIFIRFMDLDITKKLSNIIKKWDVLWIKKENFNILLYNKEKDSTKKFLLSRLDNYFDKKIEPFFNKLEDISYKYWIPQEELFLIKILTKEKFDIIWPNYEKYKIITEKEEYKEYKEYLEKIFLDNNIKNINIKNDKFFYETIMYIYSIYQIDDFYIKLRYNNYTLEDQYRIKYGKTEHFLNKIDNRKLDIYEKHNINKDYMLMLNAMSNVECPALDWMCFNWADVWPFQINQIHKDNFYYYLNFYNTYKYCNENDQACYNKYWLNNYLWLKKEQIKKDLFEKQLIWTLDRFDRIGDKFCNWLSWDNFDKCLSILHNWNNNKTCMFYWKKIEVKYCFADKVSFFKKNIKKIYKL